MAEKDLLIENKETNPELANKPKHWFWDNWVILALTSAVCYAVRGILTGELSILGMEIQYYLASGAIIPSIGYFIIRKECSRRNPAERTTKTMKVLTRTWDNRFDWWALFMCTVGGVMQLGFYVSVAASFKKSREAGLNLGIASAIWSFVPIFVAILERIFYGVGVKVNQMVGMVLLLAMAILVALSDLFSPDAKELKQEAIVGERVPVYVAVLYAFLYPICATAGTFIIKYTNKTCKIESIDFAVSFSLIYSIGALIAAIVHWHNNPDSFVTHYFIQGFIVAFVTLFGAIFAIHALTLDVPNGPTISVLNSQIMMLMVVDCLIQHSLPSWMQFIGLIIGIIGTLTLSIPEQMLYLFRSITCQNHPPAN